MPSHVTYDHALIALLLVLSTLEWLWVYPSVGRSIAAGVGGARIRLYAWILFELWLIGVAVLGEWALLGRDRIALRLVAGSPVQTVAGVALALLIAGFLWNQRSKLLARPERLKQIMSRAGSSDPMIPRTRGEFRMFLLVSISAGAWEELFFRGFAMWYFGLWGGPVVAVLLSSILFGLAHVYLGWKHVLRAAVLGLCFALLLLAAGSLWLPMLVHALVDISSGELGYRALGEDLALP